MSDAALSTNLAAALGPDGAEALLNDMHKGWAVRLALAKARQKRLAQASAQIERAGIDGVGRLRMQVDADVFHYWGQRLGYGCWSDQQFLREFERDNEEVRVRQAPRKTTIIVP